MHPPAVSALLLSFLLTVQSAPVASPSDPSPAFIQAVDRAKLLVEKILRELPAVHKSTVTSESLTLDSSAQTSSLQLMTESLGIPPAPVLKPLSSHFTLAMCVNRMSAGSKQYQELLGVLSERLSGLTDLKADLRDLLTHIDKMRETAQLMSESNQSPTSDLASRLHGEYEVQVAVHVTLTQLRSFCHDLIRTLRNVATHRPQDRR